MPRRQAQGIAQTVATDLVFGELAVWDPSPDTGKHWNGSWKTRWEPSRKERGLGKV